MTREAIKDLRAKRHELEQAIQRSVSDLVKDFTAETGVAVSYIDVELLDVSHMDGVRETLVGEVSIDVAL